MDDDELPYEVGYGRPPSHSRFKPGRSGNPCGRPRKNRTRAGIVERVRDEPVKVRIDGKVVTMSTFEVAVRQVHSRVMASGKVPDLLALLRFYDAYCPPPREDRAAEAQEAGNEVVRRIFEYFDRTVPDDPPAEPPASTGDDGD